MSDGGYLIPVAIAQQIVDRAVGVDGPWMGMMREWQRKRAAEEAALSRGYKFGRSIRIAYFDWRRRLALAAQALRGEECE